MLCVASAFADTHYVSITCTNPVPPYTNWTTAATNIQTAVDAATDDDTLLVNNGLYETGEHVTPGYSLMNRVVVTKRITVRSVNGPAVTIIKGRGPCGSNAVRCVYMSDGTLDGFTLTNGFTRGESDGDWDYDQSGGGIVAQGSASIINCTLTGNSATFDGGGASGGTLSNCTLRGNSAYEAGGGTFNAILYNCALTANSATWGGGGAFDATLYNCALTGNSALGYGGGVDGCALYNCTLTGNSASLEGGGADGCTLYDSIIYYNMSSNGPNTYNPACDHCCTTPDPGGTGNITNEPGFLNTNNWTNLRLLPASPCINAGTNQDWMIGSTDLAGKPRIRDGYVDMGAYESGNGDIHYVDLNSTNPVSPYLSWATAATRIMDAVGTTTDGDVVLLTNGTYTLSAQIEITNCITVRSVNGADSTMIDGNSSVRCFLLSGPSAVLDGFTITRGTADNGGGVYCVNDCTVTNCTLSRNYASSYGAAVFHGTLYNCRVSDNWASWSGGGVSDGSVLHDCLLSGNMSNVGRRCPG